MGLPLKILLLAGCLGAALPTVVPPKANVRPGLTAAQVSAATVTRVLRTLAADDLQGPGPGRPGGLRATQFLAGEFTI